MNNEIKIKAAAILTVIAVLYMTGCKASKPEELKGGEAGNIPEASKIQVSVRPSEEEAESISDREAREMSQKEAGKVSEAVQGNKNLSYEISKKDPSGAPGTEAVYLGVKDYGAEETNKDNTESFLYRFEIDGAECVYRLFNGTRDEDGKYDYPLQNRLKEGYRYFVTIENDTVTAVSEIPDETVKPYEPGIKGVPGELTLKNFLKTALEPVGTTLYIYGGGWDWQDEGSSLQARTIGVSSDWVSFYESKDENFTYKERDGDAARADPATSFYPYGGYNEYYYAGLDCSGFLGWALYNTFETGDLKDGYVVRSTDFAKRMSEKGWGEWSQDVAVPDGSDRFRMKPGDVMSINGHVWMSLGTCADGSTLIVHSTPSKSRTGQPGGGVQISAIGYSKSCEAFRLAEKYVSAYFPEWYERYPVWLCDPGRYYSFEGDSAGRFTWDPGSESGLRDPDGISEMMPEEVLKLLFEE
ncbi:MAG: hypothetical protein K5770_00885 [Lachnospiraceae bacterium]|nr:hypothetical protein [Lachnospiraceae bacterium]